MTTIVQFDAYLSVIESAAAALVRRAGAAGLDAAVPTCPDWRVRDLVVHQGIIHRWAAAHLRQEPDARHALREEDVLADVADDRLQDWSRAGAAELLQTLRAVDPDVDAMVFLNDAARPREFWARRQAHETTIHSVDALAAELGRFPTAAEAAPATDVAADGIDEILCGFFTRGRSKLYDDRPFTIEVAPRDSAYRWTLRVGPGGARAQRSGDPAADVVFTGTPAQCYLGLWNRGREMSAAGDADVLARWREVQHVTWG